MHPQLIDIIKDELNVKKVIISGAKKPEIWLDTTITPELEREGIINELIHKINSERKRRGLEINQVVEWKIEETLTPKEKCLVEKETLTKLN